MGIFGQKNTTNRITFENPIRILETSLFSSSYNNSVYIYRETPIWQWPDECINMKLKVAKML